MKSAFAEKWYWKTLGSGSSQDGVFERYYSHLRQALLWGLKEMGKEKGITVPELSEELLEAYLGQLRRITLRTLLLEMEICGEEGTLEGSTGREKYACFEEKFLGDEVYLREVYEAYPVMYQGMLQTLEDFVHNVGEALERFAADREGINSRFFYHCPCRQILRIGGGSSDGHRQGRRVFILELDNGKKLVYKPRSLAIDEKYKDFLGWVFQQVGMPFWWNCVWDRGKYGWCQWVSGAVCHSREEMERYYYRNGILLCVSYLLGSEDIHYENLIACGEHPVIIDLEMIVGSRGVRRDPEMGAAERFYLESVLQTGLLPLYTWNHDGEGVNVSAINGRGGQLVPISVPVVVNPGTTEMHIEYRQPAMGEGKNLATVEGKFIEPVEFLEEIQEGFGDTWTFLSGRKEAVGERLAQFWEVQSRYVVRDTQKYFMLLQTLGHPDMLVGGEERAVVWKVLEREVEPGEAVSWIREQERKELERGDIPSFFYYPGRRRLYSGTGESFGDFFPCPVMKCLERRLERMDADGLERQQKLIRMALLMGTRQETIQGGLWVKAAGRTGAVVGREGASEGKAVENLKHKAAERIAGILLKEAVWSEDGEEAGWISMMMAGYRERNCLVRPMDCYLYGGLAGIAVFMTELTVKTKKQQYDKLKSALIHTLFRHTDGLACADGREELPTGAYVGEASIAFAYMMLYETCKEPVYLQYLRKQCQVAARGLSADQEYDVLGGNAGAILVFLKAYRLTGEECYREWAREAGDCLIRGAVDYGYGFGWVNRSAENALTGFAHGAAGIMLALTRLGHEVQEEGYLKAAYQAYRYEEHYYRRERLDWEDLRSKKQTLQERPGMAWCHGWGGIVMARQEAWKYAQGNFRAELGKAVIFAEEKLGAGESGEKEPEEDKLRDIFQKKSLSLCHGVCGNLALLQKMGKAGIGAGEIPKKIEAAQYRIINAIADSRADIPEWQGMQEYGDYGLMGGITGIGYSCLCGAEKILELLCIG